MVKSKSNAAERSRKASTRAGGSRSNNDDLSLENAEIPEQLQQHILNVFRDALLKDENIELDSVIQKVKQHLYDRDFTSAFGSEQNLLAYAARWSSYRALGYLQIFQDISAFIIDEGTTVTEESSTQASRTEGSGSHLDIDHHLNEVTSDTLSMSASTLSINGAPSPIGNLDRPPAYDAESQVPAYENPPAYGMNTSSQTAPGQTLEPSMTITFLGGGAGAELVASAAWLRLQSELATETLTSFGQAPVEEGSLEVHCIDIADWSNAVQRLVQSVESPPTISKYASAAVRASNTALLPPKAMSTHFHRQDMLEASPDSIRALFQRSDLITIMFTLNELYSTSVSKTQRLLFEMTVAALPGTLLLVVDSPGSYSTVRLNNTEKKYPMQWLLDHTLLEASKNTRLLPRGEQWEKLLTDESRWFRPPKGLKYPIELENMRYQIHLYRRLAVSDDPSHPGPSVTKPQR